MIREKTEGIVFNVVPYNDKTNFIHVYTEKFGGVTYAVPNTRSKRGKLAKSLFSPFSVLEMEVEHTPGREIQKIAEARSSHLFLSLSTDPVKGAVVLFLAEFLARVVREQEQNRTLYHFILDSIALYDLLEEGKANFHLVFMLKISELLGFRINRESYQKGACLDLIDGTFLTQLPDHSWYLGPHEAYLFHSILNMSYTNMHTYYLNRQQRTDLLDKIVLYFRLHLPDLKEIKSLEILKILFD